MSDIKNFTRNLQKKNSILGPYKTIGRRFFSGMIDASLYFTLVSLLLLVFLFIQTPFAFVIVTTISLAFQYLYNIIMTKYFGGTLGKLFFNVKILDEKSEGKVTWFQAIGRELINIFSGAVYLGSIYYYMSTSSNFTMKGYFEYSNENKVVAIINLVSSLIYFIEIITSASSVKRRAVHDFVGGTVVKTDGDYRKNSKIIAGFIFIVILFVYFRLYGLIVMNN